MDAKLVHDPTFRRKREIKNPGSILGGNAPVRISRRMLNKFFMTGIPFECKIRWQPPVGLPGRNSPAGGCIAIPPMIGGDVPPARGFSAKGCPPVRWLQSQSMRLNSHRRGGDPLPEISFWRQKWI